MIKIDLHLHTGEDPKDGLHYPATRLLDRAAALGFGAIAITLHEKVLQDERLFDYAQHKGVRLIRAVEWKIEGLDVVLCNVQSQQEVNAIRSWTDLRAWRRDRGESLFVVAPHPYYPISHSLKRKVEEHIDLFDAIEHAQIHLPWLNFNRRALHLAREHGKPVIANSDAHNLWMFGRHYTLVDAPPEPVAIWQAVRAGRCEYVSPPISVWECLRMFLVDPLLWRRKGRVIESFPAIRPR